MSPISGRARDNPSFRPGIASLVLLLAASADALAQNPRPPIAADLSPAATSINWSLNTTLHVVHGAFKLKSGTFKVDPATGDASGLIVIDATSAESGDPARDKVMHRDVLESARYPEITFRPTHVDGKIDLGAPGTVTLNGVLTLHGQDHPTQLAVSVEQQGAGVHFALHFQVPYVAWGLKDPSTFIFRAGKQVTLDVDLTAPVNP